MRAPLVYCLEVPEIWLMFLCPVLEGCEIQLIEHCEEIIGEDGMVSTLRNRSATVARVVLMNARTAGGRSAKCLFVVEVQRIRARQFAGLALDQGLASAACSAWKNWLMVPSR